MLGVVLVTEICRTVRSKELVFRAVISIQINVTHSYVHAKFAPPSYAAIPFTRSTSFNVTFSGSALANKARDAAESVSEEMPSDGGGSSDGLVERA